MRLNYKPNIWILPILSILFVSCVIWVFVDSARIQTKVSTSVEAVTKLTIINQELLSVASDVTYLSTIDIKQIRSTFEEIPAGIALPQRDQISEFIDRIPGNTNPKSYYKASQMIDEEIMTLRQNLAEYSAALKTRWNLVSLLGVISCFFALLSSLLFISYRNKRLELKAKNTELESTTKQLQKATKAKSNFINFLSHEVRTPINAIIGLVNLINKEELKQEDKTNLELLSFSADNLHSLVNDILDFGKIEAEKIKLERKEFNLKRHFENVIASLRPNAKAKNVELLFQFDERLPQYVVSDPTRLSQVIFNLVNNAIKFTKVGFVKLEIGLIKEVENEVVISFSVIDSGIGIAQEKQDIIFESFEQAEDSTTRNYGGTGLGLTITRKLVELLGGEIKLKSEPDKGSTFSFELSLAIGNDELNFRNSPENILSRSSRKKVLLVEDNRINRLIISKYLDGIINDIEFAENGCVALEKLQTKKFDLVLMDLQMPELDGYRTSKLIREKHDLEDLPIIAISATSAEVAEEERFREARINDFIGKPIDHHDLINKVIQHL